MASYKHMSLDDRIEIQKGLKDGKTFAEIGAAMSTGELRTRIFYCDPGRSDQKGSIEVTHRTSRVLL